MVSSCCSLRANVGLFSAAIAAISSMACLFKSASCSCWALSCAIRSSSAFSRAAISPLAPDLSIKRPAPPMGANRPAWYATSPYSLSASADVKDSPAWARSSICWVISVGISAAAPTSMPLPSVFLNDSCASLSAASVPPRISSCSTSGPKILPATLPPNGIKEAATSKPACGTAAASALPRLISIGCPASFCSAAWRSTLVPNCCKRDGAIAPIPAPMALP